jgi:hypothetical protein
VGDVVSGRGGITLLMVLVQPFLAGQFVYGGEEDLKDVHAGIGQSLHITVGIQLVLAFLARRTLGMTVAAYNLPLLVLISVQAGIGFSTSGELIAVHIPLGAILLSLAAFAAFLGFFDLRSKTTSS